MVRWKTGQKDATRRRILDSAGQLFRVRGYASTGVSDLMSHAGLTVGGFYSHFESKEGLLAAVLADGFDRMGAVLFRGLGESRKGDFLREVTRRYLSRSHRDHPESGCVLPALAAEVGRQGAAPREEIEKYLRELVARLADEMPPSPRAELSSEEHALALTALCVGGVLLARAVEDQALSNRILEACRRLAAREVAP